MIKPLKGWVVCKKEKIFNIFFDKKADAKEEAYYFRLNYKNIGKQISVRKAELRVIESGGAE